MTKPVRVLELIASSRGGGASHVFDLATNLDPARFQVAVAMPEDGGNVTAADFARLGVPFHAVPIDGGFSVAAIEQVRRLLTEVDLLHVHGARAALFGRMAAAMLGRRRPRVLYTIHGFAAPHYPAPRRQVLLGVERALAPLVDGFVAVSQHEKDALVAAGVARADAVSVVWNGIDVTHFADASDDAMGDVAAWRRNWGVPEGATLVTMVCRLFKPRDFDTLLRAMRVVVDEMAGEPSAPHLMVVGDGPLRVEIEAQVAALDLAGAVTLVGWQREMPAVYAASDLFVLTTWGWEGLPLTVLEAMAAGKAVVASRAGGIPEEVVAGETGLLVAQQNVEEMAAALGEMVRSPEMRARMGAAGRRRVAEHFALAVMVEKTSAVYEQVLATGRAPRE